MNAISAVAEKSKLFTPAWTSVGKFWARRNCWSEDWKGVDGVILGEEGEWDGRVDLWMA